jgi:hypothetical protein
MNVYIPAPKMGVLQMGLKRKMASLSKTTLTIFIKFQQFMHTIFINKMHRWYLHVNNGTLIRGPKVKCQFLETDTNIMFLDIIYRLM